MEENNQGQTQQSITQDQSPIPEQKPPTVSSTPNKSKFKFPLLLAIPFIILVVLVLTFILWIFVQRLFPPKLANSISPKIDTSNWKTYIGDKYNYEFKYPQTVTGGSIVYYPNPEQDFITVYDPTGGEGFNVRVYPTNQQKINLLSWQILDELLGTITYNNQVWNVFFNSNPCSMSCLSPIGNHPIINFVIKRDNYIYDIVFNTANRGKSITQFQKTVLSNFKFIDKNSTTDTSGSDSIWVHGKTYNGDGYSIYYPNSWTIQNSNGTQQFYDPGSMQSFTENGGAEMQLPTKYVYINSINSTKTTQEYIDSQTANNPAYDHEQDKIGVPVAGYQGQIYTAQGEGSRGYIIVLSSSKKIITINIPVDNPNSDLTISQILSTFNFTLL